MLPANTDYILLSDTSNSGKIERSIAIGTSTTTYLRNDGTWGTPPDTKTVYEHPTYAGDDIDLDTGPLTGATVISDLDFNITTDTLGHVTDANATYSTRALTLADLGYVSNY